MASAEVIDLSKTVSVSQAAQIADVHEETIRRWTRSKRLSAQRIGLCLFINLAELNALLAADGS